MLSGLAWQWSRLCACNAGGMGLNPGRGTKIQHACHLCPRKKKEICVVVALMCCAEVPFIISYRYSYLIASLVAQWFKTPPAMQEMQGTRVQSLGREDPLEKEMATHSSIVAWRILWSEEPGGLQSTGQQKSRTRLSY